MGRREYKPSDFGEIIRGKFATTQVDFHQLVQALLSCIGEDEGVKFLQSIGNLAQHKPGDWTYEFDNGNQINLRYWQSEFESVQEPISNPSVVMTSEERKELLDALQKGVRSLKAKVAAPSQGRQ